MLRKASSFSRLVGNFCNTDRLDAGRKGDSSPCPQTWDGRVSQGIGGRRHFFRYFARPWPASHFLDIVGHPSCLLSAR
jgi:hypothetical protein